jgi:hypothetical protein
MFAFEESLLAPDAVAVSPVARAVAKSGKRKPVIHQSLTNPLPPGAKPTCSLAVAYFRRFG